MRIPGGGARGEGWSLPVAVTVDDTSPVTWSYSITWVEVRPLLFGEGTMDIFFVVTLCSLFFRLCGFIYPIFGVYCPGRISEYT